MDVLQQPQDAGHADGPAGGTGVGLGLGAVGIGDPAQIVLGGGLRRHLAAVVGLYGARGSVVVQQEPAAADAGGLRLHQAQHRLRGDERVGGGAAVVQHLARRLSGQAGWR